MIPIDIARATDFEKGKWEMMFKSEGDFFRRITGEDTAIPEGEYLTVEEEIIELRQRYLI